MVLRSGNGDGVRPRRGITRRGLLGLVAAVASLPKRIGRADAAQQDAAEAVSGTRVDRWRRTHDRVWLGDSFWANPMEDWRVVDGAAEVQTSGGDRNVHLITHRLTGEPGRFRMSVRCRRVEAGEQDGGAGFRIGVRNLIDDHRSNCFARGVGVDAGLVGGRLVLGGSSGEIGAGDRIGTEGVILVLDGLTPGENCALTLTALALDGTELGRAMNFARAADIEGNVAIVSNFDREIPKGEGARYRFSEWTVDGDAFEVDDDRRFGPILWSMYSMSDSRSDEGFVVKLTALLPPLGEGDDRRVELLIEHDGEWRSHGFAELDPDAWTATFRLPRWNEREAAPFRLAYRERHTDGGETAHEVARHDPGEPGRAAAAAGRAHLPERLLVSLRSGGRPRSGARPRPDLLLRRPALREPWRLRPDPRTGGTRDPELPAQVLPVRLGVPRGDARPADAVHPGRPRRVPGQHLGRGRQTDGDRPRYLDARRVPGAGADGQRGPSHETHRTIPAPSIRRRSNRTSASTTATWSTAAWGSPSWATGSSRAAPSAWTPGPGAPTTCWTTMSTPRNSTSPGSSCSANGRRSFLEQWAGDWRGHTMKVLLSQTVFAGVATHHGAYDDFLAADLDCGGWPQTPRNRVIRMLRKAKCLHVCGDQHLPSLVQYGADRQRDGCWALLHPGDQRRLSALVAARRGGHAAPEPAPARAGRYRRVPRRPGQPGLRLRGRQPRGRRRAASLPARSPEEQRLRQGPAPLYSIA